MFRVLFVVLAALAFAEDPYVSVAYYSASSSLSSDTLPDSAIVNTGICGWTGAYNFQTGSLAGEWLKLEFDGAQKISAIDVQGQASDCGVCTYLEAFDLYYALDDVESAYVFLGTFQGVSDCTTVKRIPIEPAVNANFMKVVVPTYCTSGSSASLQCYPPPGGVIPNTGSIRVDACGVPIAEIVGCVGAPQTREGVTYSCPNTQYDVANPSGTGWIKAYNHSVICTGTCPSGYANWPTQPTAQCYNGKWVYSGGCTGTWPMAQEAADGSTPCAVAPENAGKSVYTPKYKVTPAIVEGVATASIQAARKDHLALEFVFTTAYKVLNISGWKASTDSYGTQQIIVPQTGSTRPTADLPNLYYKFEQPTSDVCKGYLSMKIPIGYLDDWGFLLHEDAGVWYLDGEFFIAESRETVTSGRYEDQIVIADFPIRITLADKLGVTLDCDLKVYGLPYANVSIILFKESEYNQMDLTVWYLIATQYPYMATLANSDMYIVSGGSNIVSYDPPVLTPHRGQYRCDAMDTSNTAPLYCYQLLRVTYHTVKSCANGPVTYTGEAILHWSSECRLLPVVTGGVVSYNPISWCNLPMADRPMKAVFQIDSNDVCRVNLNWNPTLDVTAHMIQTANKNPNPTFKLTAECCGFVADNDVWFLIYLNDNKVNSQIYFKTLTLEKLTFQRVVGPITDASPVPFYDNTLSPKFLAAGSYMIPATGGYQKIYCNGIDRNSNDGGVNNPCGTTSGSADKFPVLYWKMYLSPLYLGLLKNPTVPMKVKMIANFTVDYEQAGVNGQLQASSVETFAPLTVVSINSKAIVSQLPVAPQASNAVVLIAGVAACVVGVIAVVVAIVIYRKKTSPSAPKRLETSA